MTEYGMMNNASGEMLALRGVEVSTRIAGLLASTTLVQKYRNDTDTNLEVSYTFPVPVQDSVCQAGILVFQLLDLIQSQRKKSYLRR